MRSPIRQPSQAPTARSQQNPASDYVAVPAARLPSRPVLRAFFPLLIPRGVLGLSSGARRSTSAPFRPGCICGPMRRQGKRHGPDCPLSTVRARAEAARTNEPVPPEPARLQYLTLKFRYRVRKFFSSRSKASGKNRTLWSTHPRIIARESFHSLEFFNGDASIEGESPLFSRIRKRSITHLIRERARDRVR
jgi:hypothetical protein